MSPQTPPAPPPPPEQAITFRLTSSAQATLLRSLGLVGAGLGAAVILLLESYALIALAVLILIWMVFFWPTKLVVGKTDVRVTWLSVRKIIPYTELDDASVYRAGGIPFGVVLRLRNGKEIRLPVFRPALKRQRQILRAILGAIAGARTRAGFPSIPEDIPSIPPSAPGRLR